MEKRSLKQLRISLISTTVGVFGSSIFSFGLGLLILRETSSAMNFGMTQIIGPIVSLILLPIVGTLIDKHSHKKIIIASQIFTILSLAIFIVLYRLVDTPMLSVIFIITMLKISDLFTGNAYQAARVHLVLAKDLQKFLGYTQSAQSFSGLISPILSAILFTILPFELFVIVEIATEIVTLILTFSLDFDFNQQEKAEKSEEMSYSFKDGLVYFMSKKLLWGMILISAPVNFFFGAITIGMPYMQIHVLGFSNLMYATVEIAMTLGFFIAGIRLGKSKQLRYPVLKSMKSLTLLVVCLFLAGLIPIVTKTLYLALSLYVILMLVLGVALVYTNTPLFGWIQKVVPSHLQGRVFTLMGTISQLLMPLGVLVFGMIYDLKVAKISLNFITAVTCSALVIFWTIGVSWFLKLDFKLAEVDENGVAKEI
ncbi:MFS transporter [Lactococcus hodotermopsidis]|uniref:MFS transporter n=1 Tax=Pseudolactococcus hodotermopsidis TaxID=2709157 RepID=A0A6A0BAR5_9LACT|nr:MFS transporter [Lactococcus hodotermopsidis]GFH41484.1 MFS transporter [Lactococcus hodotermopsidis]